jgi:ABC-type uncharacterized transport system ATPase subunit
VGERAAQPRAAPRLAIDVEAARERVRRSASEYGLRVDPDAVVETLPVGIKQRVELLRELDREPGACCCSTSRRRRSRRARSRRSSAPSPALAARGTAILVVTHKLAEVIATPRVTVMRAGRVVARHAPATRRPTRSRARWSAARCRRWLRAPRRPRALSKCAAFPPAAGSGALVDATRSRCGAGEIVGIAGIEGNGQIALADALAGVVPFTGTMTLDGDAAAADDSPAARSRAACASSRRTGAAKRSCWTGTCATTSCSAGSGAAAPRALRRRRRRARSSSASTCGRRIRTRSSALSGGNQQKIVVGRALAGAPKLVVAYQPTRGIDIGAAALVQSRLIEARNAGAGVLLISFELDEIFACADRVLVLARPFAGEFSRDASTAAASAR